MTLYGTRQQRKLIGDYVRWMANELELRDWTIVLCDDEPSDADCWASIAPIYGRKLANLRFRRQFWDATPKEQRQVVCHELIHCHLQAITWNLNSAQAHLGLTAFSIFEAGHKDATEFAVDALADAFAKRLPLPKQPKVGAS